MRPTARCSLNLEFGATCKIASTELRFTGKTAAGAKQAAEKGFVWGKAPEKIPSAAKADVDLIGFMRGINPPPPSVASFSAACKAVPLLQNLTELNFSAACKAHLISKLLRHD